MTYLRNEIVRLLGFAIIALLAAMVVNVLWQVFSRFVLRDPSTVTDELARYLLIWLCFLGASYVVERNQHLAISYLLDKARGPQRRVLELAIQFAILVFATAAMVVGGIKLVAMTFFLRQTSAALQIQLGLVYLVIPISGALIVFFSVCRVVDIRLGKTTDRG